MDDGLPRGAEPFKKPSNAGKQIAGGALVGAGFGFALSLYSVWAAPNGRTTRQKAEDVVVPTVLGAAEGAAGVAVMRCSSAAARGLGGVGVAAAGAVLFIGWDAIKVARGRATVVDLRKNAATGLAAGGGGLAGAAGCAALGTFIAGPVGGVIGGILGGIGLGFGGAKTGELLDRALWDEAEDVKEHAFEFMHYRYRRWNKPDPKSPEELQQRYEKRVAENPDDGQWLLQCQQNLHVVMSELWPQIHQLELLVEEEMNNLDLDQEKSVDSK